MFTGKHVKMSVNSSTRVFLRHTLFG
jgi:hypothetical protein